MPKFPQLPRVVFVESDPNYWRTLGKFIEAFSTCAVAPERRVDLDKIFSQLKSIVDMRNKIIHYGTFVTIDKGRVTSTAHRTLTPERVEEHRASIEVLQAMTADIIRIYTALLWDLNPNRPSPSDPSLRAPWQHKSESPTAHRKRKNSDRR